MCELNFDHPRCRNDGLTAQEFFDRTYISSSEIVERLHITRATLMHARRKGRLPDPVVVNASHIYLWERTTIEPYLRRWEQSIAATHEHVYGVPDE